MTPDDLGRWLSLALSLVALGTVVWNWLASGGAKALAEVRALREEVRVAEHEAASRASVRLAQIEQRLLKMEGDLAHLPDREQTHRLELAVERLSGRLDTLDERLKPVGAVADRLQEYLLDQAAKR